ncbi:hypothetical protein GCM10009868_38050 [Terrabacter aerolatus]|uniref:Uncharacterized protein n=1 Tax=Terrabacter aerolatus TaxID=422442 RepID=A0A512CVJ1_9MICO|nr:hypothetical protein [Terrabacter aerolatus]GEO28212.1 hypothetical protein TAE01_00220 [Terrabacter aerolatus]
MRTVSVVLRRTALVLTAVFACGGLLFALGYAFEDPGGGRAVLLAAVVVVPLAALTALAALRRRPALRVLAVAVGLYAVWGVVALFVDLVDAPDLPMIALVLALPLAVVGLTYALRAGVLLVVVAAVPLLSVVSILMRESDGEGPGLGDLLGGSTGVVVVPLLVLAGLFLLAGALDRGPVPDRGLPADQPLTKVWASTTVIGRPADRSRP